MNGHACIDRSADAIVRFTLVQTASYSPTATINVSHEGFNTSVRFINLPSY